MKPSKVDCRYGAPMGRPAKHWDLPEGTHIKLHLVKMRLDSGGYDSGGAYWGLRIPVNFVRGDGAIVRVTPCLYWYYDDSGMVSGYIDAVNRAQAKAEIRRVYPLALFWR